MEQYKFVLEEEEDNDKDGEDKHNEDEDDEDVNEDSNVDDEPDTSSPTTSNKKSKYNAIMPPDDEDMAECSMAESYPHLSRALGGEDGCFDPTNPSVQKSMHCLLSELHNLLSSEYQLDVNGLSHNKLFYVQVQWIKSNCSFLNLKEWVDTTI
jgi:hypothetical protein